MWQSTARLRAAGADASWTAEQNLHITLKFLGEVEDGRLDRIASSTRDVCEKESAFEIRVSGTGAFPDCRRPRVLWAGITEGAGPLLRLQAKVEAALVAPGFEREARPFHAHVTLGRARSPRNVDRLADALASLQDVEFGTSLVAEIVVMRSQLRPGGAVYTPLERFPLKS